MCRRGTPAARSPARAAAIIGSGSAQEDVSFADVGHDLLQAVGRQMVAVSAFGWAEQVVDLRAAVAGDPVDLVAQYEVVDGVRSIDQGDVAGPAGQGFEQRPQRGDADAAGEEQDLALPPASGGERSVRAFSQDRGSRVSGPVARRCGRRRP